MRAFRLASAYSGWILEGVRGTPPKNPPWPDAATIFHLYSAYTHFSPPSISWFSRLRQRARPPPPPARPHSAALGNGGPPAPPPRGATVSPR